MKFAKINKWGVSSVGGKSNKLRGEVKKISEY